MTEKRTVTIKYAKAEFEISGDYVPLIKEHITDDPLTSRPAEGGYFVDFTVKLQNDVDISELLNFSIMMEILRKAELEAINGG